jgi:hypothetical protein
MPRRTYWHNSLELDGRCIGLTERVCCQCGRIGEFGGWDWGVVEQRDVEETFPQECPDCQGAGGHPLLDPDTIARARAYTLPKTRSVSVRPPA